jgi:hypothetical protein
MRCVAALCFLGFRNLIQNGVVFFVMKNKTSFNKKIKPLYFFSFFSHIKIDILTYVQKIYIYFVKIYSYYAFEKYVRD